MCVHAGVSIEVLRQVERRRKRSLPRVRSKYSQTTSSADLCTPTIRTSLSLPDAPDFIDTADLAQPKRFATSPMSSTLALPSTGGDWIRATHVPALSRTSSLTRDRGLTRTSIRNDASSFAAVADRFDITCSLTIC